MHMLNNTTHLGFGAPNDKIETIMQAPQPRHDNPR